MNTSYEITKRPQEITRLNPEGEVTKYFRITARSRGGSTFTVDVEDGKLDQSTALLEAKAKQLDAVK